MSTNKIPFGRNKEAHLPVHISDAIEGRACNCYCHECKSPLIAKKGLKNVHHFAHDPEYESDYDCTSSGESAIHRAAKLIIENTGYIQVPDYDINLVDTINNGNRSNAVCTN